MLSSISFIHELQHIKGDITRNASCSCGAVVVEAFGPPMTSTACYCDTCQEGSRQIEALPNAAKILTPDGGTAYVLYRKDRVKTTKGAELLKAYKLDEKSTTNASSPPAAIPICSCASMT